MKILLLLLLIFGISITSTAQNFDMYVVKAGRKPSWSIPDSAEFKFPQFQAGYIEMEDNKRSQDMKMNFSHLFVSPVLLAPNGDTVMISTSDAKSVWIGKSNYVLINNRYYEVLSFAQPVKLAKQHFLRVFRTELVDTYGTVSTARTSQTVRGTRPVGSPTLFNEISQNTQQSYKFQTDYYFIGPNGKPEVAKKSLLMKRIKSKTKKEKVAAFIEENKTDFKNEADLIRLMEYCEKVYRDREQITGNR